MYLQIKKGKNKGGGINKLLMEQTSSGGYFLEGKWCFWPL
jgi:hypothetical protein